MIVSAPIAAASRQLQDIANVTFPTATLLTYLNYAVREIIDLKPEAGAKLANISLVAGTRQSLPAGWNMLINAKRNMGASGATPGRVIVQRERKLMDEALPFWDVPQLGSSNVVHMILDEQTPDTFYVFPPQPAGTTQTVEAVLELNPANTLLTLVAGVKQTIPSGARAIIDAVRNMGTGSTPGKTIQKILKEIIDSALPDWTTYTSASDVNLVIFDGRTPDTFYVFPPQPALTTQKIEAVIQPAPATVLLSLVAGSRQNIPSNAKKVIDPIRNMGTGTTPGSAIIKRDKAVLDTLLPGWLGYVESGEVQCVVLDERDPLYFDVFPPQPALTTQKIEAIGSVYPDKVTDPVAGIFPLQDQYEVPVIDYIIYRALYESTTVPNALNKAQASLNKFYQGLGIKGRAEAKVYSEGQ